MLPTDRRKLRSDLHRQDVAWRMGYKAGRYERWALLGAGALGAVVEWTLGHRERARPSGWHLIAGLIWLVLLGLLLSPIWLVLFAGWSLRREWRSYHHKARLATLGVLWLASGLAAWLAFAWSGWVLVAVPGMASGWVLCERAYGRRRNRVELFPYD